MRAALIAAAASVLSLTLVTGALAQTASTLDSSAGAASAGSFSQTQQSTTLPGAFLFTTRRAGIGPGGFEQLCDDPLDPRLFTGECSAARIAQ